MFPLALSVTQLDTFQTKSLIHLRAAHLTSVELSWWEDWKPSQHCGDISG